MSSSNPKSMVLHATTIDISGRGVAIIGESGSGKSSLAIRMISMGAILVSDDQTLFQNIGGKIFTSRPRSAPGLIEARGIGLITVPLIETSKLHYFVGITNASLERLPPVHNKICLGISVRLIHFNPRSGNDAALYLMLKYNKIEIIDFGK